MAALDVCVSSPITEGFSDVIGEAMACGVQCAVTDVGDSAAIVGETGVVPPQAPNPLAEAMADLLRSLAAGPEKRSNSARQRIINFYSLDAVARRYADLFSTMTLGFADGSGRQR